VLEIGELESEAVGHRRADGSAARDCPSAPMRARSQRMTTIGRFRIGIALAMLPLLGGCVAAIAVPLMTAAGAFSERRRSRAEVVADLPAANAAALAVVPESAAAAAGPSVQLTGLKELPPPSGAFAAEAAPWRAFATYTLARAAGLAEQRNARSALLTQDSALTFRNELRPCTAREAAVVIDLDPADAIFAPGSARQVPLEIAATVSELREAGVVVLWVSQASANDVAGVAEALKASGLDPAGRDPILLVRNEEERKQVLREEANQTVCVVAMAGDRRSDFDELFDYLRDPRLETAYDAQLGAGWFLVPPLFEAAPGVPVSAVAPPGEDGGR
jgi:hypothetical protein